MAQELAELTDGRDTGSPHSVVASRGAALGLCSGRSCVALSVEGGDEAHAAPHATASAAHASTATLHQAVAQADGAAPVGGALLLRPTPIRGDALHARATAPALHPPQPGGGGGGSSATYPSVAMGNDAVRQVTPPESQREDAELAGLAGGFATLHTADTMQAFARILEFFPSKEHAFIRSSLAVGLKGVLAQRLLPTVKTRQEETQRIPATEVLLNTVTVADRIRDGKDEDLPAIMSGSEGEGMHNFTQSLARLIETDWVDMQTALRYAPNPEALQSRVKGINVKADTLVGRG